MIEAKAPSDVFASALAQANSEIHDLLARELAGYPAVPVVEAMRYALEGGKGLRGFLVVEVVHTYSLVHDDLPAMDDDDLRRGRPTVHVKWDEATAILVGDALHCLAFDLLARTDAAADPAAQVALVSSLAQAAGARGMVLGQALDIAAETAPEPLTLEQITELQAAKTGALIRWAGEAGAILAGADPGPLRRYAEALGLAFQIADDILDLEGDAEAAGKRLRKDAGAGKATFVSLLGVAGAKGRARDLVDAACAALDSYGTEADVLRQAARFVIARRM